MTPSVAVTGAGGFIGRHVFPLLAAASGGRVAGIDFLPRPSPGPGEWLQGPLSRLRELAGPFILVHLAWDMRRNDPEAQRTALEDFRKTLEIPGCIGLVGLGSAEEYGSREGCLAESMAPGPDLPPYGKAKHAALRAAQEAGIPCFWLRPFIVYGEGQRGDMVVPYALRCLREGIPADFSSGEQFRDFIHVRDVAGGIAAAVRAVGHLKRGECRVCNLGRGEPVQLREVLARIAGHAEREDLFRFGVRPMRPGEPVRQFADTRAAEAALGWRAAIPWRDGIDRLCRTSEERT